MNILHVVVELEVVLEVLKRGVVVSAYKSGGKNSLKLDSYRGVTLTSMVEKVLEFLLLKECGWCFLRKIFQKSVSCADAIFATQEVIARYVRGGSKV